MNLNYIIIILGVILAIIFLAKDRYFEGKIPSWLFFLIIILLLFTAMINVYITKQEEEKEKYSKSSGLISGELKNKSIIYPVINLGGAKFVLTGGSNALPFKHLGKPIIDDPLEVWIENNELKISAVVRDKSGKIMAILEANEWQVNPNNVLDRNFDKNAVEVINEKGEVILQADFNGKEVNFAGIFTRQDGWKVAIGPAPYGEGGMFEFRPPNENIETSFNKIFRYPSEQHPGERR